MSANILSQVRSIQGKSSLQGCGPKGASRISPRAIIIIAILLSPLAVQPSSCGTTATAAVTAIVLPAVEISRPSITWEFTPTGPGTYSRTESILVKARTDWQLLAEDSDPGTSGHLAEWTGAGYGPKRLKTPLRIAAASKVSTPILAGRPIETGMQTGEEGRLVSITLTQDVVPGDRPISGGQAYRIVVNLKAEPDEKSSEQNHD
ncbi:MAG TPA: hypothetical protein PKK68_04885 [Methanothrix soehngenii]|jgi:hypothetical protein|nr:hypothetical protein [Methanothrix soehngenii]